MSALSEVPAKPPQSEGLTIIESPKDVLALNRAPEMVLDEARRAAQAIQQVIESKPNKVVLNNKTYLQFEDWQTLGRFYGVTAIVKSTEFVEYGDGETKVRGFAAQAEALLVSTNQVISSAEAMCLNDEDKWGLRPKYEWQNGSRIQVGMVPVPLFQLKSMAQTRACAKALRNVLAWVVVLAGYQPTPAEEMNGDEHGVPVSFNDRPSPVEYAEEDLRDTPPTTTQSRPNGSGNVCNKPGCGGQVQPAGVGKKPPHRPYDAFCRKCKAKQ